MRIPPLNIRKRHVYVCNTYAAEGDVYVCNTYAPGIERLIPMRLSRNGEDDPPLIAGLCG